MFLKNVDVNDDDDLTLRMARSTINTQPSTFFVLQSYDIPTPLHSPFEVLRRVHRKFFLSFFKESKTGRKEQRDITTIAMPLLLLIPPIPVVSYRSSYVLYNYLSN